MFIVKLTTEKENFYFSKDNDKGIPFLTRQINKSMTYKTRREAENGRATVESNVKGFVDWVKPRGDERYSYPQEIMDKSFFVNVVEAEIREI